MLLITVWAAEEPQGSYSDNFVTASNSPVIAQKRLLDECNCVKWLKGYLGAENEIWGIPRDMTDLYSIPRVGSIIVTSEGEYGHIGYIEKIEGDKLYILEANYKPCEVSTRILSINAPQIRGYLR